jgi:hypothetical protein
MTTPVFQGWVQITGVKIQAGDRIETEDGWADASNIARQKQRDHKSVVGQPTALFARVIRKIDSIRSQRNEKN